MAKQIVLQIRLSEEEHERLLGYAKNAETPLAKWARGILLSIGVVLPDATKNAAGAAASEGGIAVEATEEELAKWKDKADSSVMSVIDWIKARCNHALVPVKPTLTPAKAYISRHKTGDASFLGTLSAPGPTEAAQPTTHGTRPHPWAQASKRQPKERLRCPACVRKGILDDIGCLTCQEMNAPAKAEPEETPISDTPE